MDDIHEILNGITIKDDPNAETLDDILEDIHLRDVSDLEFMKRLYKCRHKTDKEWDDEEKERQKKDEEEMKKYKEMNKKYREDCLKRDEGVVKMFNEMVKYMCIAEDMDMEIEGLKEEMKKYKEFVKTIKSYFKLNDLNKAQECKCEKCICSNMNTLREFIFKIVDQ